MLNIFKANQTPFGLDISDISLKLVQLEKHSDGYAVRAFSDAGIPNPAGGPSTQPQSPAAGSSGASDVPNLKDTKTLISVIKSALTRPKFGKISSPYVVASIPETKSFVRVIQMPAMSEEEAVEAVPWEAEQYIPMPMGQVYLDWVILNSPVIAIRRQAEKQSPGQGIAAPSARDDTNPKMTVLITASPKDYIDGYMTLLKEAGLVPVAVEVESAATARSLVSEAYLAETILIADINTVRTSLIIYDRGILQFTSSIPIAGNVFSEKVAKSLNISFEEAEKHKREVGLEEEAARQALAPVLENLTEEIKNIIRFYEEHTPGRKISRILLSGGSAKLKHLPSFLHEKFSRVKVELGDPWVKVIRPGQTPPLSREDSLSYATAIGLALREMSND